MVNHNSLWKDKSNGYEIDKLYVQSPFQGRGIGGSLILEVAAQYGGTFWLSTWFRNEKAIGFYKHLGFIDIGHTCFEFQGESHENRVLLFKNA
jgi:diamine N-acetyltransferase